MAASYAVLNSENFSISNIQIFFILVSVFLSLKYKYCNTAGHFCLHIFVSTFMLVILHLWSHSNFLLSTLLLSDDSGMNPGHKFTLRNTFQSVTFQSESQ